MRRSVYNPFVHIHVQSLRCLLRSYRSRGLTIGSLNRLLVPNPNPNTHPLSDPRTLTAPHKKAGLVRNIADDMVSPHRSRSEGTDNALCKVLLS